MTHKLYSTVEYRVSLDLAICVWVLCICFICACEPAFAAEDTNSMPDFTVNKPDGFVEADRQIRALLQVQADDWNKGDIEHFVEGYRKSESTLFVGATGVKRGWSQILERYKTQYPDRKAMGHLTFSNLEVHLTSAKSAYAVGEFDLELADKQHRAGYFTLNLVKSGERWEIVADHTTARQQ